MDPSRRQALQSFSSALAAMSIFGSQAGAALLSPTALTDGPEEFLAAVRADELDTVSRMLAAEPTLAAAVDARGRSAYVLARIAGADEVAARLLEEELELDIVEAVLAEDWSRVEELAAAAPASLDAAHPIGGGALYAGALCGVGELYRLRSLGCSPDARPKGGSGFTPPRAALECEDPRGALSGLVNLLSNGSDPNAAQRDGSSVLHGAVRRRNVEMVRLVLRKGGDFDAKNSAGETPLQVAQRLEWREGAALLKEQATVVRDHRSSRFAYDANRAPIVFEDLADVSKKDQSAVTANSHGNLAKVRELLAEDPRKIFAISSDDELAIEACAHTGNRPVMQLHLDHGAPYSLPTAVSNGDLEFARFLLDDDPKRIHERGAHDFALMWYTAIGGDQAELAELLIERGVPVDQNSLGTTALHLCASRDRRELAGLLIWAGADVHAVGYSTNRSGETPLQVALAKGNRDMAKLLREAGAEN